MTIKARKYLSDILCSENFLKSTPTFRDYRNDLRTKGAVERYLTIVGEAVHKFSKESSGLIQLANTPQIIAFRNRIVHAYDSIDDAIVWVTVKKEVPKLKKEVAALLQTP